MTKTYLRLEWPKETIFLKYPTIITYDKSQLVHTIKTFPIISQVKTDIDHLFVLVSQLSTIVATLGTATRIIFGPLPYILVVIMVELLKFLLAVNLAFLNASYIVQFFLIFDFR